MSQDILIVLSHEDYPEYICTQLTRCGITPTLVVDVQGALRSMESHTFDFLLLDLDLEDAVLFLQQIMGEMGGPLPYLMLADDFSDSAARTEALTLGADLCLKKPIDVSELVAVIGAALRRAERLAQVQSDTSIRYGEMTIDILRRSVSMRGKPVYLTTKEFEILRLLASHPDVVFTKQQIYDQVWNEDFSFASTSVSDHISSLRQKLGLNVKDGRYIQTVYGTGYRFSMK